MQIIRDNNTLEKNIVKLLYRLINNLLYFDNNKRDLRLYISTLLKAKCFNLIYDKIRYLDYARIYKKLTNNLYIFEVIIKLYKFIRYFSHY